MTDIRWPMSPFVLAIAAVVAGIIAAAWAVAHRLPEVATPGHLFLLAARSSGGIVTDNGRCRLIPSLSQCMGTETPVPGGRAGRRGRPRRAFMSPFYEAAGRVKSSRVD